MLDCLCRRFYPLPVTFTISCARLLPLIGSDIRCLAFFPLPILPQLKKVIQNTPNLSTVAKKLDDAIRE
jgi:hypothetical protein